MNQEQHEKVFFNRANVEETERIRCENCFEDIVFALKDSHGNVFSLGLSTMLECLKFSEKEGVIPKLPTEWWINVHNNCCKGDFL